MRPAWSSHPSLAADYVKQHIELGALPGIDAWASAAVGGRRSSWW
jgi:hypothetical protein